MTLLDRLTMSPEDQRQKRLDDLYRHAGSLSVGDLNEMYTAHEISLDEIGLLNGERARQLGAGPIQHLVELN